MKKPLKNIRTGIITCILLILSITFLKAENKSISDIKANYTGETVASGEWNDDLNWDQSSAPDPTSDKCNLTFFHDIDYNPTGSSPWLDPFEWQNNITIIIKSGVIVTINSDLFIDNNFNITIETGGQFIVDGNVEIGHNVVGEIDGEFYITGDLTISGGGHGNITGTGEIIVDGTITDERGVLDENLVEDHHRWLIVDDGDWDDNNSWSKTQGGSVAISPPNHQCIVHIENSYTVNIDETTVIAELDVQSGGTLNVDPAYTLTVSDDIISDGHIILKSDANGTAALIFNGATSVTATCERYVTANEYHYVSSPMTAAPVSSFNVTSGGYTNPNFYWFDETEINADWMYAWRQALSGNLSPGLGYALYTDENYAYSLQGGSLINQDFNVSITNTPAAGGSKSWNLIGNPFPCNIDADTFIDTNDDGSVFTGSLYFWDDDGSNGGDFNSSDYIVYTLGGGTSGGNGSIHNGIISPLQAFFVQANTGGDLAFTSSAKTTSEGSFLKGSNPVIENDLQIFRLSIQSTEGVYNDILIKFSDNAENGIDIFDGLKLKGNDFLAFYSILNKEHYAIQGFPELNEKRSIQLGVDAKVKSKFLIKAEDFINIDENIAIYLEDTHLEKMINLRTDNYNVNLSGTHTNRFILHFMPKTIYQVTDVESVENNNIYSFKNILYVNDLDSNASFEIYDISGKIVFNGSLNSGNNVIELNLHSGYYLIKVTDNSSSFTKKLLFQ